MVKLKKSDNLKRKKGYQRTFNKHGLDPKALQWASRKAADIRYRELVKEINFENKTVLDVGCGFGDILPHIKRKTKKFNYTGIDIVPEFIEAAREKYPDHKFITKDYFGNPPNEKYDLVLTSGTLNSNTKNAIEKRKAAIKLMFDQANEALVFNMAGYPNPENREKSRVYYTDPVEILEFCLSLTKKVILRHNYHPRDFTIVMQK